MKKLFGFLIALCLTLVLTLPSFASVTKIAENEILISGGILQNDVVQMTKILHTNKFKKRWIIEICSPGGHTSIGISIYNLLKELTKNGVEVVTVVRGEAASMGAIIFLAGSKRIVYEGAQIMFHKAFYANSMTGQKMTPPKGSDQEKSLNMTNDFFIKLFKQYFDNDEKKTDDLLTKQVRYSAKELYDLGIATEYIDLTK